jgi:nucleoside-diphosphate-sugar epimerase
MAETALVSGLNGFIGHHLKTALEKKNISVVGLPHDLFYKYEMGLQSAVESAQPDYIFHLASYGNMREQKYEDDIFSANLLGTYNLLKATKDLPYKTFVNISTSSVLLDFETMYSATKAGAEHLCKAFADNYNKRIITVRPYSIYGEHEQETHLIPRIFRSCLYREPLELAPDPRHDYVFVDDFVSELIAIAQSDSDYLESPIHIGTGVSTSNGKILSLIEGITQRKAKLMGEREGYEYDTTDWKANPRNGYVIYTPVPIEEGLQKVYNSYKL